MSFLRFPSFFFVGWGKESVSRCRDRRTHNGFEWGVDGGRSLSRFLYFTNFFLLITFSITSVYGGSTVSLTTFSSGDMGQFSLMATFGTSCQFYLFCFHLNAFSSTFLLLSQGFLGTLDWPSPNLVLANFSLRCTLCEVLLLPQFPLLHQRGYIDFRWNILYPPLEDPFPKIDWQYYQYFGFPKCCWM